MLEKNKQYFAREIQKVELEIGENKKTLSALKKSAGISPSTWRNWKLGLHEPSASMWMLFEKRLKVALEIADRQEKIKYDMQQILQDLADLEKMPKEI